MPGLFTWFPNLPDWAQITITVVNYIIRIVAVGVIPGRRKPATAMAWLLVIFFIPLIGLPLYLLIGSAQVNEKRRESQKSATDYITRQSKGMADQWTEFDVPEWVHEAAKLNFNLSGFPAIDGNRVTFFSDYIEALEEMTEAVNSAQESVDVEFYILSYDSTTEGFFHALAAAQKRGVKVRVLMDQFASSGVAGYRKTRKFLRENGIEYHLMMPIGLFRSGFQRPDLRNHRKIVVVDQYTAYSGSMNMIERAYRKKKNHRIGRKWVEVVAKYEGPNAVALNAVFATDWYMETGEELTHLTQFDEHIPSPGETTCQVIPSGPGYPTENNLRLFNALFYNAAEKVSVVSPYTIPDESLQMAMTTAAHRGVEVELFVSEKGDQFMVDHAQRSYYYDFLKAGVRIYRYPAPYVLHSKFLTVDDYVAVLGSSNMDQRSFALNNEVMTLMVGGHVVRDLHGIVDQYRALSKELPLEEWKARPRLGRFWDNLFRLSSGLQ